MIEIPDRIWLQTHENEWTWCKDHIEDTDVEYVRADLLGGEPVGEVCEGRGTEGVVRFVEWTAGKPPEAGSKLYLAQPAPSGEPVGYVEEDQIGSRTTLHLEPNASRVAVYLASPQGGQEPCPGCAKGKTPEMLDEDGTLSSVSGRPGKLGHAVDDYWWYCDQYTAPDREMKEYDPWCSGKRCDAVLPGNLLCQLPKGHTCDHLHIGSGRKSKAMRFPADAILEGSRDDD